MGGHLALLQTIAWGGMLADYSSNAPFSEAIGKTFGGEHPCSLCKVVEKSKDEEEKKPVLTSAMKIDVALPAPVKVPFPRWTPLEVGVPEYSRGFAAVYHAVPVQPPRGV